MDLPDLKYKLPKKIYMNTNLDSLLAEIQKLEAGEEVVLSFAEVDFILPETTILLISISRQIYLRTGKRVVWSDIRDDVRLYLERIQIDDVSFIELPKKKSLWKKKTESSLVEMKVMSKPSQVDEMISDTKQILYRWFPERRAEEYVKQISEYIRHIAGNSLEHSKA